MEEDFLAFADELDASHTTDDHGVGRNVPRLSKLGSELGIFEEKLFGIEPVINHADFFSIGELVGDRLGDGDNPLGEANHVAFVPLPEAPELLKPVANMPDMRETEQPSGGT